MKKLYLLYTLLITSCSMVNFTNSIAISEQLQITSTPSEAIIKSDEGEIIGTTPVIINKENFKKIAKNGVIRFDIEKNKYHKQTIVIQESALSSIDIKLKPNNDTNFSEYISLNYQKEANIFLKEGLRLQLALLSNKVIDENEIDKFIEKYPTLTVGHTMKAYYYIQRKKYSEAKTYIQKAISIDSTDETALRMDQIIRSNK